MNTTARESDPVCTADITRRIGSTPQQRGSAGGANCPDILELADGRYLAIGTAATAEHDHLLPPGITRQGGRRIVIVDRAVLVDAKGDIPDA